MLEIEWDENKNRLNRQKHDIWFEEAQSCFDDRNGRLFLDPEFKDEDRFILVAFSSGSRLLVVVHCYRKFISWCNGNMPSLHGSRIKVTNNFIKVLR